ncbi:type VII secretion system-associated protein [Streptomyces sp. NBC_00102]|uniref:type VII secretion system-associated protein n=1 Tax=Streptomyces sp. NBC_00102 TaxID=2975652 RepID=UPI00225C0ADB|nr:type VII secretion system-associated protein [Streptomyces sp. NBC_00102]MCX5400452.1 type VII secretion system-associated protein [Streptomyces sp. NBC_00102]
MADTSENKLALDKAGIQRFITEDVKPFLKAILDLRKADGSTPSMGQLLGLEQYDDKSLFGLRMPLAIGVMADDKAGGIVNGNRINSEVSAVAESILKIMDEQEELFNEFIQGLEATLKDLFDSQNVNLEKIDGEKFLDNLTDVDSLILEAGTNTSGTA